MKLQNMLDKVIELLEYDIRENELSVKVKSLHSEDAMEDEDLNRSYMDIVECQFAVNLLKTLRDKRIGDRKEIEA